MVGLKEHMRFLSKTYIWNHLQVESSIKYGRGTLHTDLAPDVRARTARARGKNILWACCCFGPTGVYCSPLPCRKTNMEGDLYVCDLLPCPLLPTSAR